MRLEGSKSDLQAGIKRSVLEMGLLSAVRRPSFRPLLTNLFRLLVVAAAMSFLYRFYRQFTSGNPIEISTIGYIVGVFAFVILLIELAGMAPVIRIVRGIETLIQGNREYNEVQARLARCRRDHEEQTQELQKLEKELERHRSIVRQGSD